MLLLALIVAWPAFAADPVQTTPSDANKLCLECHSIPDRTITLPSGETLSLVISGSIYAGSVHGQHGIRCIDCHTNIQGYPHPPLMVENHRDLQYNRYRSCFKCHPDQYEATLDSIHAKALASGNRQAAICTDCHGSHDISDPAVPRKKISLTCSQCHAAIFARFKRSVHGAALMNDDNPDVPTCINCHPAHHIEDPRSAQFRLKSPDTCGKCHADNALMDKYGISTDVFSTYVADFHGTTVKIFEDVEPNKITNKAVCSDCHDAHLILAPTNKNSSVMQANLLTTCKRCHPDADNSFTASWMGHYPPDWKHHPIVAAVNWFYKILIPGVLGFFAVFIGLDMFSTAAERRRRRREWRLAHRQEHKERGDQ